MEFVIKPFYSHGDTYSCSLCCAEYIAAFFLNYFSLHLTFCIIEMFICNWNRLQIALPVLILTFTHWQHVHSSVCRVSSVGNSTLNSLNSCCFPPYVQNGWITNGSYVVGSQRHVECERGYSLVGQNTISCLPNGQWSTPGICKLHLELKLVGSKVGHDSEGFITIRHFNKWYFISSKNFNFVDAQGVCRILGYRYVVRRLKNF